MSGSATSALPRERSFSASHRAFVARLATPSASAPPEGVPADLVVMVTEVSASEQLDLLSGLPA
jgi:hypothetical protein